jgi:hypothetical protein
MWSVALLAVITRSVWFQTGVRWCSPSPEASRKVHMGARGSRGERAIAYLFFLWIFWTGSRQCSWLVTGSARDLA